MNNQSYEEYIRSIIGYPTNSTYFQNSYERSIPYNNMEQTNDEINIKKCYPKIYNIVNPMVEKACSQNTEPITENLIDKMTREIYFSLESELETEIKMNINLSNNVNTTGQNSNIRRETKENREKTSNESRQLVPRNPFLNDLIRILIINELLRKNQSRPPFPGGRPPRPPFPGVRPPIMPRNEDLYEMDYYNNFNNIYEY